MAWADSPNHEKAPEPRSLVAESSFSVLLAQPLVPNATIEPTAPERLPQPFRRLLVHSRHMTPTLTAHYNEPLRLRVISSAQDRNWFTRRIQLVVGTTPEFVVEHAIVRIDLSALEPQTVSSIKAGREPLGTLLRHHGVQTSVQPHTFVQMTPPAAQGHKWYGRIGSIDCDGKPAIQMFEMLTGVGSTLTLPR